MTAIDIAMLESYMRQLSQFVGLHCPSLTIGQPHPNPTNDAPFIFVADHTVCLGRGQTLAAAIFDAKRAIESHTQENKPDGKTRGKTRGKTQTPKKKPRPRPKPHPAERT